MSASIVRRIAGATALVLAGVVGYLCFWPVPADPRSWSAPTPPGYVAAHLTNTRLAGLRTIGIGHEFGPEHIAMGPDGKLYAAMTSGSLLRMDPDGSRPARVHPGIDGDDPPVEGAIEQVRVAAARADCRNASAFRLSRRHRH